MNDLLGGKEPRDAELRMRWPKIEARTHERAPRTISRTCQKRQLLERKNKRKEP